MPTRMLDGEIARSESLSQVSRDAAFTFVLLISVADDHGRFDGRPRAILAALYGMRDDVQLAALETWLEELEEVDLIRRYEVDERPYLRLPKWFDYQRRRESASKWPDPPQESEPVDESAASCGELPQSAASCGSRARAPGSGLTPGAEGRGPREEELANARSGDPAFELEPDPRAEGPPKSTKRAEGKLVLERMAAHAEVVSGYLGLPALDCRWTVSRQKLISAAHKAYPEHGAELGVAVLEGFRRRAAEWTPSIQLGSWSVEAMFAPANVGKNLQAIAVRVASAAPAETAEPLAPMDFGQPIGAP